MRSMVALVIANGDLEQIKMVVQSIRKNNQTMKIKVLYHLFQREVQEWCDENNILSEAYGGNQGRFSTALKRMITEISSQDIFLVSTEIRCLPEALERMQPILYEQEKVGAVIPNIVTGDIIAGRRYFKDLSDYAMKQRQGKKKRIIDIGFQAILLSSEFIKSIELDEKYFVPANIFMDMVIQGTGKGYIFYQLDNAFMEEIDRNTFICEEEQGEVLDFHYMDEKWRMGYVLRKPNEELLKYLHSNAEEFRVLEVGCSSGTNLMEIGNLYPKAKLFGLEINPNAAKMASAFADVRQGNIEEKNLDFGDVTFDYIIFGDVLEHLHDPKGTLEYCKSLLSERGKIIASIPNLMHWSVMKVLLNGFFPYADYGLLDKTHIHFFTYYEMIEMFEAAGYEVCDVDFRENGEFSQEAKEFVNQLMNITESAEEFMFWAFQYRILAEKK